MNGPSMVGTLIGTYRLAEPLGDGGLGEVYRAVESASGKEAAFRVFSRSVSGEAMLADRLRAIAPALKKLQHPNIGAFYELVTVGADLVLFLEYVPGSTLELIRQQAGHLEISVAVSCAVQILRALEFAHSRGVLHHALRPTNVMVTRHGTAKVLDFGIAHAIGASRKTREDRLLTVLACLAPEQIQNQPGDARSDLYAVGVILYEMLTGRLPFDHRTESALRQAQINESPASLRLFVPELPEWLDQAVLRSLAKHPISRYQNATEFRAVLEAALGLSTSREAAIVRQRGAAPTPAPAPTPVAAVPAMPAGVPAVPGARTSGSHPVLPAQPASDSGPDAVLPWAATIDEGVARSGGPGVRRSGTHPAVPVAPPPLPDVSGATAPAALAGRRQPESHMAGAIAALLVVAGLVAAGVYFWKRSAVPEASVEPAPVADRAPAPARATRVPAQPAPSEGAAAGPSVEAPAQKPKPVTRPPLASKPLPSTLAAPPLAPGAAPGAGAPAPAAAAAVARPLEESFHDVKLVTQAGDPELTADVVLMLGEQRLSLTPDGGGAALRSVRYRDVTGAAYSKTEKRQLGLISSTQHMLTIETRVGTILLYLDGSNVEAVIAALEARVGRTVRR